MFSSVSNVNNCVSPYQLSMVKKSHEGGAVHYQGVMGISYLRCTFVSWVNK